MRLSEIEVKKLQADVNKQVLYRDTEAPGLALRITKAGHKTFVLNYSVAGRERRMRIGDHPAWSVQAAREQVRKLRRAIDQGVDPLDEYLRERAAPTVQDLWQAFRDDHLPSVSAKYAANQVSFWDNHVLPKLGRMKLAALKSHDIDELHRDVSKTTPILANRVVASVRKALNYAKRREWVDRNVAEHARRNREHGRERYLDHEELSALLKALEKMPNLQAATVIRLLLFTGARRGEVLGASWKEFDLGAGTWTKPADRVKTRRNTTIPLSPAALEFLMLLRGKSDGEFLFPSRTGGAIQDIKRPWSWLVKEAGLNDFRIHDLRHTHASILVSQGQSLEVIGRLLGHTQAQTTARYSHLMQDPLRHALSKIDATIAGATSEPEDRI